MTCFFGLTTEDLELMGLDKSCFLTDPNDINGWISSGNCEMMIVNSPVDTQCGTQGLAVKQLVDTFSALCDVYTTLSNISSGITIGAKSGCSSS